MQTDWDTGYFLGINPGTTEYVIGKDDGVFSCATIRRLPDDDAFDPAITDDINVRYKDYVIEGASSTPVMIRPASIGTSPCVLIPLRHPNIERSDGPRRCKNTWLVPLWSMCEYNLKAEPTRCWGYRGI